MVLIIVHILAQEKIENIVLLYKLLNLSILILLDSQPGIAKPVKGNDPTRRKVKPDFPITSLFSNARKPYSIMGSRQSTLIDNLLLFPIIDLILDKCTLQ